MNQSIQLLLTALIVAAAAVGGWYAWQQKLDQSEPGALRIHGNVDIRQVELAFNASARIARMHVDEGDHVQSGQLLGELETDRLRRQVDQAAAQVAAQAAVVRKLRAGPRPQEIQKLRAELEAAEYRAEDASHSAQRLQKLAQREMVSEEEADSARLGARAARAQVRATREALQLALEGSRKEDIEAAEAKLEADRAGLALMAKRLDDASLHAPVAGVIEQRLLEPGDMASPQRPVYTLARMNPMWVRTYVNGSQLGRLRPGMRAEVSTDSFPDKTYQAWIGDIASTAEFTPKTVQTQDVRTDLVYRVRVMVCNPEGELRLGMPATVTIALDQPPQDLTAADRCERR